MAKGTSGIGGNNLADALSLRYDNSGNVTHERLKNAANSLNNMVNIGDTIQMTSYNGNDSETYVKTAENTYTEVGYEAPSTKYAAISLQSPYNTAEQMVRRIAGLQDRCKFSIVKNKKR